MIITDKKEIIDFLTNRGADYKGRTHEVILNFSDEELEKCHDQIQWMFPLHEESKFAETYPIITLDLMAEIRANEESVLIAERMRLAMNRMLQFYKFDEVLVDESARRTDAWPWCMNNNHNLLRITRILRSARFFGVGDIWIDDFYRKAVEIACIRNLDMVTFKYWNKAMFDDLWESLR